MKVDVGSGSWSPEVVEDDFERALFFLEGGVLSVILSIFTLIVRFEPLDDAVDLDEDDVAVAAVLAPGDEPVAR